MKFCFFSFPSSGGTSPVTCSSKRGRKFPQNVSHEYFPSVYARDRGSLDKPYSGTSPWMYVGCW